LLADLLLLVRIDYFPAFSGNVDQQATENWRAREDEAGHCYVIAIALDF
jgi:hypothetical protein